MISARYIVFEGIDCAGKSTQMRRLTDKLRELDVTPVELFEPTYGPEGKAIRQFLKSKEPPPVERQIEMFTLDRRFHVRSRIRPLLALMKRYSQFAILQHRYYLSAPAYQGGDRADQIKLLRSQQRIAPRPDLVILLDVSIDDALRRLQARKKSRHVFETRRFLSEVRRRYLDLASDRAESIVVINGSGTIDRVAKRVWDALSAKTPTH